MSRYLAASDAATLVAVVAGVAGAMSGLAALWRQLREGPRLDVTFYVYQEDHPKEHVGPVAIIRVVNVGTIPAYLASIGVVEKRVRRVDRWPILRAVPYRTRRRWWLAWLYRRWGYRVWGVPTDPPSPKRIEAGEAIDLRLVDVVNGDSQTMDHDKIETRLLGKRSWAIVETGIKGYFARVNDFRPGPGHWALEEDD